MRRLSIFLGLGLALCAIAVRSGSGRGIELASIRDAGGFSGAVRALFVTPEEAARLEPGEAPRPGVRGIGGGSDLVEVVLTPFAEKVNGRIGQYALGRWPYEDGSTPLTPAYADPRGFVEVTPQNASLHVSEHFTLGQFVTKNQTNLWPKYIVLQPQLLDKLELTIAKLRETGHPVRSLFVMSGFRTPDYNALDLGPKARSKVSRHMYGDAADVYPDDHGTGMMDDLNGDGRVDLADAKILADAAEAVEREHPSLVGGIGIYPGNRAHGPFVHIDVRGKRARWNG
ncbi:MAG TPA: hypothetical protein VFL12_08640 [Thermoanaerobaculia bacterium]|nr:hypothetical protein [Thermoanaerobaculia bacterium]